jgi:PKD-like domain/Secretion system C-terminal sorting domain/IPT/TIG domain
MKTTNNTKKSNLLLVVKTSLLVLITLITGLNANAQTYSYDFGSGTGIANNGNAGSGLTTFFSSSVTPVTATPSGGGTYRVRIGSAGGALVVANPGTSLGTNSEAQITAATTASTNKMTVFGWTSPTTAAYLKLNLRTTSSGNGNLNVSIGDGGTLIYNDNTGYTTNYNVSLTSLTITYSLGAISSVTRRTPGANTTISSSGFSKDANQAVEFYCNNSATTKTYYISATSTTYTLNAQSWDLYVAGSKISPAGGYGAAGTLAAGTALAGFGFYAETSTSNLAIMYIDDLEYGSVLPATPPDPTTSSLSPTSIAAGSPTFTLTVNGSNFFNGTSTVRWNGSNRTTTYVSSSQLKATINAADVTNAGTATVDVITTGAAATSNTQLFTINAAAVPTKLVITSISPSSPTAGSGFDVTVQAQDNSNNTQNVSANTSFTLSTNGNAGSIGGTTTGTIANGTNTITVSGVTLPSAGTGVTITATQTSGIDVLTAGTSATFTVLAAADHLLFFAVPSSGFTGTNLSTFNVLAYRPDNSFDNTFTGTVTVTKASGPGTLSGTTTKTAVAGIATFNDIQLSTVGTYSLLASSGSLTTTTSSAIAITPPIVSLGNYPFTGTACSAAASAASGVVAGLTFSAVATSSVTCNANAANQLSVAGNQPSWGTAINLGRYVEFVVTPTNGYSFTATSISFDEARSGAGATNLTLRSSIDGFASDITATTISLTPTVTTTLSGSYSGITSALTFRFYGWGGNNVGDLRLDNIVLNGYTQVLNPTTTSLSPNTVFAGGADFTLTVNGTNFINGLSSVRWNGNTRTTSFVNSTQLTTTVTAADIASVGTATVDVITTGAAAVSNAQTLPINISTNPTKFAVTAINPTSPTAGSGFSVTVVAQDNSNIAQNVLTETTFSLSTNGNAGSLGAVITGTITAGSSSVVVSGVTLASAGTGVTITADGTGGDALTSGTSSTFNVLAAANHLAFVSVPSSGITNTNLSTFTVEARRPDNSLDNTFTGTVSVAVASGPGSANGTTTRTASAGVATFNDIQLTQAGTYTLNATSGALTQAISSTISITQAPVTWNFGTVSGNAAPSSGTPVTNLTVSNVSSGNLNGTAVLTSTTSVSSGYTGASGQFNAGAPTYTLALNTATSTYFEFSLTPDAGYRATISSLSFGSRSTGTGPAAYTIRSSADGYVSTIATGTLSTASTWELKSHSSLSANSLVGSSTSYRIYGHSGTGNAAANSVNWRIDDLTFSVTVTCPSVSPSNAGSNQSICSGSTATLAANTPTVGAAAWTILSGPSTNMSQLSSASNPLAVFTPDGGVGTYNLQWSITSACATASTSTMSITVNPVPTPSITGTNTICAGQSTTFTASGGTSYLWNPGGTTDAALVVSSAGTYTTTVTNAAGCSADATRTLTVNAVPTATITGTTNICAGTSTTLTASGGTTYLWNTGATTAAINTSIAGLYSATVTTLGCSDVASETVTVNNRPTSSLSGTATVCNGSATALNLSLTGVGTINGTINPGSIPFSGVAGPLTVSVTPIANTTYTVATLTDDNCTANSGDKTGNAVITLTNLPPAKPGIVRGPLLVCTLPTATYSVAPVSGATSYTWTLRPGMISPTYNPAGNIVSVTIDNSVGTALNGYIQVTASNACGTSLPSQLWINNTPASPGSISGPTKLCNIGTATYSCVAISSASTYNWSFPAGIIPGGVIGGTNTVTFNVPANTNITGTVSVTTENACGTGVPKKLLVNSSPAALSAIAGPSTICVGMPFSYSVAPLVGLNTYNWSTSATTLSITGNGNNVISVTAAANFGASGQLRLVAYNGCANTAQSTKAIYKGACPLPVANNNNSGNTTNAYTSLDVSINAKVYPNPASTEFNVEIETAKDRQAVVELYDVLGNKVSESKVTLLQGVTLVSTSVSDYNNGTILFKTNVVKQ